jgi:hypothetical protein
MADDISKKITIGVEADTDGFTQNIANLNKIIDGLLAQQKQLDAAGKQNSATFGSVTEKLADFQKKLRDVTAQASTNAGALNSLTNAYGNTARGSKEVNEQVSALSGTLTQQEQKVAASSKTFDVHKVTADALKSSFKQLKGASGEFGTSLQEAAKGFDALKSGLAIVDSKQIVNDQKKEDKIVRIKKTGIQQVEDYAKQSAAKIATNALQIITSNIKQQSDAKIAGLEKDKAAELSNSSLTSAQKLAIEQKYKQQESKIKTKAFKEEQEASIAQTVINGAVAISKVWADGGILGALDMGVVIAETAAQVAKIASQKPPAYARGGLHYQSDGRGGVLPGYSRADNTNAYLRSGEGVVVSEAMRVPWARNLVSAVNVGFGGRDFSIANPGRGYAVGGIFTDGGDANRYYSQPANDQKNLANTIAYQMINNFPPVYVDVKDVNNQQNILAQTINRVNL